MAIYHLSVKTVSRSAGRSATAAAAYRAGCEIADERTGEVHDYTRKRGVVSADLVLPAGAPEWAADRAAIWNAAEKAEKRKNSTVAREFEVALPAELDAGARRRLAQDLAREIVERHGCAADVAIHAPGREGDNRNHHAHILLSTRRLGPEGFGEKTRELDDQKTGPQIVAEWRERWADLVNEALARQGHEARVDHRTLAAQGIEREPTRHLGPAATGYERRTGEPSRRRLDIEADAAERLARAQELGRMERAAAQTGGAIIALSGDLSAALRERDQLAQEQARQAAQAVRDRQAEQERAAQQARERAERERLAAQQEAYEAEDRGLLYGDEDAQADAAQQARERRAELAQRERLAQPKPQPPPMTLGQLVTQPKPQPQPVPVPVVDRERERREQAEREARAMEAAVEYASLANPRRAQREWPQFWGMPDTARQQAAREAAAEVDRWREREGQEQAAREAAAKASAALKAAQRQAADASRKLQEWREAHPLRARMGGGGDLARAAAASAAAQKAAQQQAQQAQARHEAARQAIGDGDAMRRAIRQHRDIEECIAHCAEIERLIPMGEAAILALAQAERDRQHQEAAVRAEQERERQEREAREQAEQKRQRRINYLMRSGEPHRAGHAFARLARAALREAGTIPELVDWRQVERAAIIHAVQVDGWPHEEAIAAILRDSPGAVTWQEQEAVRVAVDDLVRQGLAPPAPRHDDDQEEDLWSGPH